MNENDLLAAILGQTKLVAEGGGGGSQKWGSGQTLFDGANLYYSDGSTFVDSAGSIHIGQQVEAPNLSIYAGGSGTFNIASNGDVYGNGQVLNLGTSGSPWGSAYISNLLSLGNTTAPSTPTGGFVFYSIAGQPHFVDANGFTVNLSSLTSINTLLTSYGITACPDGVHTPVTSITTQNGIITAIS